MISIINKQTREEIKIPGPKTVHDILRELDLVEASVLVLRRGELLTRDIMVPEGDTIEIVPVISGG